MVSNPFLNKAPSVEEQKATLLKQLEDLEQPKATAGVDTERLSEEINRLRKGCMIGAIAGVCNLLLLLLVMLWLTVG